MCVIELKSFGCLFMIRAPGLEKCKFRCYVLCTSGKTSELIPFRVRFETKGKGFVEKCTIRLNYSSSVIAE